MPRAFRTAAGITGLGLLLIVMAAAIFGPFLAPYDPQVFHPANRLEGPSAAHWLGTDQFGRDLLSRILNGAPSTIFFGLGATLFGVGAGSVIGVIAHCRIHRESHKQSIPCSQYGGAHRRQPHQKSSASPANGTNPRP